MTSQDNPIYRTITDILGLGGPPKSFEEKVSAVERLTGKAQDYRSVVKSKIAPELIEGSEVAFGKNIDFMYAKLHKAGLVPETAQNVFERVKDIGGQIGYNPKNNVLFIHSGGGRNPIFLPTSNQYGGIDLGGRSKKINNLLVSYTGGAGFERTSFLDTYYATAEKSIASSVDLYGDSYPNVTLSNAFRKLNSTKLKAAGTKNFSPISDIKLSSLMLSGTTMRGMNTPFEAGYSSQINAVLGYSDEAMVFAESLGNYRTATAAFSMLAKTSGRSIFENLKNANNQTPGSYEEALDLIRQHRSHYINEALPKFLTHLGVDKTFIYGKYEYLGNKKKFAVASKALGDKYGTLFEKHTAAKGMHQMAKITNEQTFKVAVLDLENELYSRLYFSDGGGIIANRSKFAFDAPLGSMRLNSPKDSAIKAIESLFGVNLAQGSQMPNRGVSFGENEIERVLDRRIKFKALSDRERNLRSLVFSGNQYNEGLIRSLAGRQGTVLGKISMEEGHIQLDFLGRNSTPGTIENIVGARRQTGAIPLANHPLRELFPNVDYIIPADEFGKMHGQSLLTSNFKEVVRAAKGDAFVDGVFKNITTADDAFYAATEQLRKWQNSSSLSDKTLAHTVTEGQLLYTGAAGVKAAKLFHISGGLRSDFMGDINITKPVRMTLSKMKILASGSKLLGYGSAENDPLYRLFTKKHGAWKKGLIRTRGASGQLALSQNHMLRQLASALYGKPNIGAEDTVIRYVNNRFYLGDTLLDRVPSMDKFSHGAGGVKTKDLSKTILGLNKEMVYLDLGAERSVKIFGEGTEQSLRYLPVPLKYLRATPGAWDSVVLGKSHPSYDFIQSLSDLERGAGFDSKMPLAYSKLLKALPGRDGIFAKSNTILNPLGTRVRLSPGSSNYFTKESLQKAENFYTDFMSEGDFEEWLTRKSKLSLSAEKQAIRDAVKKRGFFYAVVGVDPSQRAEHIMLKKVYVKPGEISGFGQVNLQNNPLWLRSVERDTDRDPANLISAEYRGKSQLQAALHEAELEERYLRQTKRISPFVNYHYRQLMSSKDVTSTGRLGKLVNHEVTKPFVTAIDYLAEFLGVPKSLGYSMVRSTDQIMSETIAYGVEGARSMGVMSKGITSQTVSEAIAGFAGDLEKTSVAQQLMQNVYQGAVQKGQGKRGLIDLAENLITLGQKYKGQNFSVKAVQEEAANYFYQFLEKAGSKERSFMALDWMAERGLLSKTSTEILLGELTNATADQITAAEKDFSRAASEILGEYAGPGAVFASSVQRQKNTITSFLQKTVRKDIKDIEIEGLFKNIAGIESAGTPNVFEASKEGQSILDLQAKKMARGKTFEKVASALKNHKFATGLGVGAVLGAGIVSMMSGPAPMPRDIDTRQPEDIGPDSIFPVQPPKIYGTNQGFTASRRRANLPIGEVTPYRSARNNVNNVSVTNRMTRDSQMNSPYSDYNY